MTEQPGRHADDAAARSAAHDPAPSDGPDRGGGTPADTVPGISRDAAAAGEAFRRPAGLAGSFAPRPAAPAYTPPPPTVAPELRAAFARPEGAGPYAPPPGGRPAARPVQQPAVPWALTRAFGAPPEAQDGFAPPPGTRIDPAARAAESPWWKENAQRDPWRDPTSSYWLGRGAIFTRGAAEQVAPDLDVEHEDEPAPEPAEQDENVVPIPPGRARFGLRALGMSIVVALVAGVVGGFAGYWFAGNARDALHRTDVSLPQVNTAANRPPGSVAAIARKVGPAVVSLAVSNADHSINGVGSGVVIDKHGYVLTNNHVAAVAKGGGSIIVTFSDEATARAQIVGLDPISDLAVLKVPTDALTVAPLGNSGKLAVGDPVIAIGSPLGLEGTVTSGIVSALNRPVHVFADNGSSDAYLDAIQTDAAINPGNSGGALVDAQGAVIGINSAAALGSTNANGTSTQTSGIGYAIPIDYARQVALQLIRTGRAAHGSLDAQGRTAQAGLQVGAYLEQVVPKGAAASAGLRTGDVVIVADGKPIMSWDQLIVIVQEHRPGDHVTVTYFRGSAKKTTTITLGSA